MLADVVVESARESLVIRPEERHGRAGFRVSRYELNVLDDVWQWDESYQFHPDLETAIASLDNPSLRQKGREAF